LKGLEEVERVYRDRQVSGTEIPGGQNQEDSRDPYRKLNVDCVQLGGRTYGNALEGRARRGNSTDKLFGSFLRKTHALEERGTVSGESGVLVIKKLGHLKAKARRTRT